MWRWAPALLSVALVWAASLPGGTAAASEPTRAEYVAQLEKICKPRSEATRRAVRGMRSDLRSERLKVAATKFEKARQIFTGTVGSIKQVPQPAADRVTLARWFTALDRETMYLGEIVSSLRAENIARFQRAQGQFARQGSRANNIVVSFGFNYCAYKPSRFE